MDRYNRETRSWLMSRVRKGNTKLERSLADLLESGGLTSYVKYSKDLPGSPDFVFVRKKVVVFLDSCFWHGCPKHLRMPKSNLSYWRSKIAANRRRDSRQTRDLTSRGWRVLRIWEHDLKAPRTIIRRIRRALAGHQRVVPVRGVRG